MGEVLDPTRDNGARLRGGMYGPGAAACSFTQGRVRHAAEALVSGSSSWEDPGKGLTRDAFEQLPCLAMLMRDGVVFARNALMRRLTGFAGLPDSAAPLGEVLSDTCGMLEEHAHRDEDRVRFDCTVLRRHGEAMLVSAVAESSGLGGDVCRLVLMLERTHEEGLSAGPESSFLEDVLDASPGATVVTHGGRVLYVNAEFARMFDYTQMEMVGRELDELLLPDGRLHEAEMIEHQLERMGRASLETQRRTRTGRNLEVLMTVSPLRLGGEERGLFVTYRDIHVQKQEEARLRHSALHDGLTGLANRSLFSNRAELMLSRLRRRPDRGFAIFFIDLDGFKNVNDELGHAAGDAVLLEVSERLCGCVRPQDTVARYGGDEFALLLDETNSEAEIEGVAMRLQAEIQRVMLLVDNEARISASIGIAVGNTEYADADAMLRDADWAMYAAKHAGKARFHVCAGPAGRAADGSR